MRHQNINKFKVFKLHNLASALILNTQIKTSKKNARNLIRYVEKLITVCIKYHSTSSLTLKLRCVRKLLVKLRSKFISFLLIHVLAKNFLKFKSGHLRIINLPNEECCLISFLYDHERY
ncbi:hypothetical protein E5P55_01020 [Candidatus Pinguicoccus supinus]|uniref:50S ribosomal protein L17 n=1 Tax=Candidatus Pinguicoccus supinus TaxID=2529394 RepID=A0A7T0BRP7_9BACT|nr:hypothetical protein E5P55_01020 [Candidatus Pinguicoccus supinus]